MANSKVILSHLKEYLLYAEAERERRIESGEPYRLNCKNLSNEEQNAVQALIKKIKSYSFDHSHLSFLIQEFNENEANLNHLYITLCTPSPLGLNKLMELAKFSDESHRDKSGSVERLFNEGLYTCMSSVAVLVKSLFAVIALPIALIVGLGLSCKFNVPFYDPAYGYLLWLQHSMVETNEHAKSVKTEYSHLTYDKATESASAINGFFNQRAKASSGSETHFTSGTIETSDRKNAVDAHTYFGHE